MVQERQQTAIEQAVLKHEESDHFVVNTHAMHNAHLVRSALDPELIRPRPLHGDRFAYHRARGRVMQEEQHAKRAQTAAKTKQTKAQRKIAREQGVGQAVVTDQSNLGTKRRRVEDEGVTAPSALRADNSVI